MCVHAVLFGMERSGLAVCLQLRESGRYSSVWETNSPSFSLCSSTDLLDTQTDLWTQGWAQVLYTLLEKQQTERDISCER